MPHPPLREACVTMRRLEKPRFPPVLSSMGVVRGFPGVRRKGQNLGRVSVGAGFLGFLVRGLVAEMIRMGGDVKANNLHVS
jgi:hypothetical protein